MNRLAIAVIALVLLAGCGSDEPATTEPIDDSISLTVTVVDGDGAPAAGVNVNVINEVVVAKASLIDPPPHVTLPVMLLEDAVVRVAALDLDGNVVRTVVDEVLSAGRHEILWSGIDDDDLLLASGRYTLRTRIFEVGGASPVISGDADVFLQRSGTTHVLGVTDDDGELVLTDETLFPYLRFPSLMIATDASAERVGVFGEVGAATVYAWRDGFRATSASVSLDWGPMTASLVAGDEPDIGPAGAAAPSPLPAAAVDDPEWSIGDPYPNPF